MIDVSVLVCTYRRQQITDTLRSIFNQTLRASATIEIVVADNDDVPSARHLVETMQEISPLPIRYVHAPAKNISIARNACLDVCQGQWIAFIDDDETAIPEWLERLLKTARDRGADAVMGPAIALYPDGTPDWIRQLDYHTNRPVRRDGMVMTGHTCNALLKWRGTAWQTLRFDIARGQSGGEDTAFFFAANTAGAKMEIADDAAVHERADPRRLNFRWIAQRSFRSGQSYVSVAKNRTERAGLALLASVKCLFSLVIAPLFLFSKARSAYWIARALFHAGVVAGCFSVPHLREYG